MVTSTRPRPGTVTWSRSGSRSRTTSPSRDHRQGPRYAADQGHDAPAGRRRREYYVKMLYHEYLEGLRQMEAGGDVSLAGSRLQAVPDKLGRPDLGATEYGEDDAGQPVYQPYQPLLAAIDKAKAERRTVVLADAGGRRHRAVYEAFQDGTMRGGGRRRLRLGLRHLAPRPGADGGGPGRPARSSTTPRRRTAASAAKVAAELEKSGVPASDAEGARLRHHRTPVRRRPARRKGRQLAVRRPAGPSHRPAMGRRFGPVTAAWSRREGRYGVRGGAHQGRGAAVPGAASVPRLRFDRDAVGARPDRGRRRARDQLRRDLPGL